MKTTCDVTAMIDACTRTPIDIVAALALADALQERGWPQTAEWVRKNGPYNSCGFRTGDGNGGGYGDGYGDGGGYGYGDGYGYGYGYGYGDGGGYGDGYGYGDGGGDGGGDGYGDGGGDGYGYGDVPKLIPQLESLSMTNGFYVLSVPSGYSPYVLVGWVERQDFLLRIRNSRIVRRFGTRAQLGVIAQKGPQPDTQLLDLFRKDRWVALAGVLVTEADPTQWQEQCPKPDDWED